MALRSLFAIVMLGPRMLGSLYWHVARMSEAICGTAPGPRISLTLHPGYNC